MTYSEARKAMHEGKRVRLSDWTGYWFDNGKAILAQLKNGDIVSTPNIERYSERDDWEMVETPGLGFDFAVNALKNKKTVFRLSEPEIYYILQEYPGGAYLFKISGGIADMVSFQGNHLIHEDWVVYNP